MVVMQEMNIQEIDATIAQLRARKRILKHGDKTTARKIATLERRRTRLLSQIQGIDEQISTLKLAPSDTSEQAPKRRGRKPKSAIISVEPLGI